MTEIVTWFGATITWHSCLWIRGLPVSVVLRAQKTISPVLSNADRPARPLILNTSIFLQRKERRGEISETDPGRSTGLMWRGPKTIDMLESCFRCAHVKRLAPATSSDKPLNYTSILFSLNQTCFLHVYFLHDSATGTDGGNDNTGREISERPLFCSMERAHRKRNRTSND